MSTFWKTPKKAAPSLLARLSETKDHALQLVSDHCDVTHESLASKFNYIESTLQQMEDSLVHIEKWDTMVVEQLGELDQVLNYEIFSFKRLSQAGDKVKQIEEAVLKLNSLVSTVAQSVIQSPGPVGPNSEKPPLNVNNGKSVPLIETVDNVGEDKASVPSRRQGETDRSRCFEIEEFGIHGRPVGESLPAPDLLNENNDQSTVEETADHGEDKSKAKSFLSECFHCLEGTRIKMCLVLLSVFPENKAILKRSLIYWWIGEGIINKRSDATAEEVGEQIFQELLNQSIIKRITRNSFMVYTSIRRELIKFAKNNRFLEFSPKETPRNCFRRSFLLQENKDIDGEKVEDLVTVYNMNEKYLGSSLDLLSRPQKLEVLQMGRWQDSATHHIEAEDHEKLLEKLGSHKQLKYVSLRGISRIETLPRSIRKLTRLLILDLRACHNLNKLPEEVAELRSLTHLDVSECYLLDSMPKGLQRLSDLQVLKGFVVSNSNSNSCNISDLAQLQCLRKLSVRVGKEKQLGSLTHFKALHILTITWRVITSDEGAVVSLPRNLIELPRNLIKLDLRSVPFNSVPEWMEPGKLPNLKKLYIKGGMLRTLHHEYKKVESIRLNYLKHLQISQEELVAAFPDYRCLQRTKCDGPDLDLPRAGHAS